MANCEEILTKSYILELSKDEMEIVKNGLLRLLESMTNEEAVDTINDILNTISSSIDTEYPN